MPEGYLNFSMHEEPEIDLGGYLERLRAIKAQVDAKGIFRRGVDLRRPAAQEAASAS